MIENGPWFQSLVGPLIDELLEQVTGDVGEFLVSEGWQEVTFKDRVNTSQGGTPESSFG
jgi:hypothetical protein